MKILIAGATSSIAIAVARLMIDTYSEKCQFVLMGRNKSRLNQIENDLTSRGADVVLIISEDLSQLEKIESSVDTAWSKLAGIDIALIAQGNLPEQISIQNSWPDLKASFDINALSYLALLTSLGKKMESNRAGNIAVISSVAGDRGRQSNYIYGSAKGAVSLFTQGLRNRLYKSNVNVLTVKPGFVDTPMTDGMNKDGLLWSTPEKVASDIVNAIIKKKSVIYTPGFWRYIMLIIKAIPEFIFKRLSL